ncbi:hypothetical protein BO71DRAFT_192635 [Aspergillus ellipticus CBS 707.79]|uniref:Uncharacterized protein n=1 Tax=Aspergillus ellipticus CBS 707.79 TaxID=1448320 RepID=A0A319DZ82_9EURO|nr:hypothetical protein BO71DRAFT_192635 [Aspergillus ellipticus CBS 707.79]
MRTDYLDRGGGEGVIIIHSAMDAERDADRLLKDGRTLAEGSPGKGSFVVSTRTGPGHDADGETVKQPPRMGSDRQSVRTVGLAGEGPGQAWHARWLRDGSSRGRAWTGAAGQRRGERERERERQRKKEERRVKSHSRQRERERERKRERQSE